MEKGKLFINFIIGILLFSSASGLSAQDFTQWRGNNRDGSVKNFEVPEQWPVELHQQWKVSVGLGDASPVESNGRLYIFTRQDSSEILRCLDSRTGKELWQNKYTAITVTGPSATMHSGPRSTPTVAEGKVVTFGVGGVLSCIDALKGQLVWRKENTSKLVPQFYTGMSPAIEDGLCFAHLGGKEKGEVVALDLITGREKWKWSGDGPTYSSPVILTLDGKKQIVFITEKNIIGFNLSDGKVLWQVEYLPQSRFYNASTPFFIGQTLIITGQGMGTRAIEIKKQGDNYVTSEIWHDPDVGTKYCTPVLNNGYLYGVSDRRKIFCMDAVKGQTAWIDTIMHTDFGAVLNCGSVIMVIPGKTELIVLSPDANKYTELARVKISDSPVYAHPLLSGKIIYIKDKENLTAYSAE